MHDIFLVIPFAVAAVVDWICCLVPNDLRYLCAVVFRFLDVAKPCGFRNTARVAETVGDGMDSGA